MNQDPIFAIRDRANELRGAGVDVISLAAGEPDTPTAEQVLDAAARALKDPAQHRYGPATGMPALRETVAERLAADTRQTWSPSDVLITLGVKHALFLTFHSLLRGPQKTVLVTSPDWPGHRAAVAAAGGRTRPITTMSTSPTNAPSPGGRSSPMTHRDAARPSARTCRPSRSRSSSRPHKLCWTTRASGVST